MLKIVMCLKESIACEELDQYTPDTPDVTLKTPAEIENNFWRSVVASRHNRRMIFVVERGRSKVDQPYLWIQEHLAVSCAAVDRL